MSRTNIDIDDEAVQRAMRIYGKKTKKEAVDLALRRLTRPLGRGEALDMEGSGWEADLDEMRSSEVSDG